MRERLRGDVALTLLIKAEELLQDTMAFLEGDPDLEAINLYDKADSLSIEIAFLLDPASTKDKAN